MEIKPIRTDEDYRAVLGKIETLMMAEANSPEGERLDVLVTLAEAYEKKNYALDLQQFSFWRGSRHSGMDCRNPVPWTVTGRLRKCSIKHCE